MYIILPCSVDWRLWVVSGARDRCLLHISWRTDPYQVDSSRGIDLAQNKCTYLRNYDYVVYIITILYILFYALMNYAKYHEYRFTSILYNCIYMTLAEMHEEALFPGSTPKTTQSLGMSLCMNHPYMAVISSFS